MESWLGSDARKKAPQRKSAPGGSGDDKSSVPRLSTTRLLAVAVFVLITGTLIAAWVLRHFDYQQQIIINDFLTCDSSSADSGSETSGDFGKEVSDIFASDLDEILQQGSSLSGGSIERGKSKIAQPFDQIPRVPVSKSYGIEIQGISIDQLLKVWNSLRYDQRTISGDIVRASDSPSRYVLQISVRSDQSAEHWRSQPFSASQAELFAAVQTLAENYLTDTNPEIAGRYFLTQKQYSRAASIFDSWLTRQSDRPEPNLYLAKTLIMEGEYKRAKPFADRAGNLVPRLAWKNRKRMLTEVQLAQAMALWGSGNFTDAETLFSGPLIKQPDSLDNLGVLYLEKRRYADAEAALKQTLDFDSGDFRAAITLGQTYAAENKTEEAVNSFRTALQVKPGSSEAADFYLEALHAAHHDDDAAQYCEAWVGATTGADAMVADPTYDLYLLCAQAERGAKKSNLAALAWYYAKALAPQSAAGTQDVLFSNLVDSMPEVLCGASHVDNEPPGINPSDAQTSRLAAARLTVVLRKRATVDRQAASFVEPCERTAQHLQ